MANTTLIAVAVGASAAGLPAVASAWITGKNQVRVVDRQASIDARERRAERYEAALLVLQETKWYADIVRQEVRRGAGQTFDTTAIDTVRQTLYGLYLHGTDDVHRAAHVALGELQPLTQTANEKGAALADQPRSPALFTALDQAVRQVNTARLLAAVTQIMSAMRADTAHGAVLAPPVGKRLHVGSIRRPAWLGGKPRS